MEEDKTKNYRDKKYQDEILESVLSCEVAETEAAYDMQLTERFERMLAQESFGLLDQDDREKFSGYEEIFVGRADKTIDDYYALPDNIRVELIDGRFYAMGAPTGVHQMITAGIFTAFFSHIKKNRGNCRSFISPIDVQLDRDNKTMVQPDIIILCDKKKTEDIKKVFGAPDLAVEVVSPSSLRKDMYKKFQKYRDAGVREYWIVLPEHRTVLVYEFDKSQDPVRYSFSDRVPVGIWDGQCSVDFREIFDDIREWYKDIDD